VTEADDDGGRYFSEERLSGLLEQVKARPVRQIVRDVIGAVQVSRPALLKPMTLR